MARSRVWLVAALALAVVSNTMADAMTTATAAASERCFPDDFLFGTATAAYQVEGGWNESGRERSIWDDFCRAPDATVACANVADDFFHRYRDDVQLMAGMGLNAFRLSISWSRVMRWDADAQRMTPNPPGIAFYRSLLDELHASGIAPVVTLYHWDLPSALHTELSPSGWLNPAIVDHFVQFARLMFDTFGRDVPYWATFNEPWSFTTQGYGSGRRAPGLRNSSSNAYLAAHHVLLAHAEAVALFRELKAQPESQIRQDARVSIVLNLDAAYPLNATDAGDVAAAERKMQFGLGWYLEPIVSGEYPAVMRERAGDRLPQFTAEQAARVAGSYDLFMLNHYSSKAVTDCSSEQSTIACDHLTLGWEHDLGIDDSRIPVGSRPPSTDADGRPLCAWFSGFPEGYTRTIQWMHARDPRADILLTENGWCGNETVANLDQLWYYDAYLSEVQRLIADEHVPIIGYTAWSFVDNYEWGSYAPRFGLYYVEFTPDTGLVREATPGNASLQRVARPAAHWFGRLARSKCLGTSGEHSTADPLLERSSLSLLVIVGAFAAAAGVFIALAAACGWRPPRFLRRQHSGEPDERSPLVG